MITINNNINKRTIALSSVEVGDAFLDGDELCICVMHGLAKAVINLTKQYQQSVPSVGTNDGSRNVLLVSLKIDITE